MEKFVLSLITVVLLISCLKDAPMENEIVNINLKKGSTIKVADVDVEYLGSETKFFEPPMETRSRTYFKFRTQYKGTLKVLEYSEGFPGGMSPKPRLNLGSQNVLLFDWTKYSQDEIDMEFRIVTLPNPNPVEVVIGKAHLFPTFCSIVVSVKSARPTYTKEMIEQAIAAFPKANKAAAKKYMEDEKIRILNVSVDDIKSAKTHNFIVEETSLANGPKYVSDGKLPYTILMNKEVGKATTIQIRLNEL